MLLDTDPHITIRSTKRWRSLWTGDNAYREDFEKTCTWVCDNTGGETTHEATYGTGGYLLTDSYPDLAHGKTQGKWVEVYIKKGTVWTTI